MQSRTAVDLPIGSVGGLNLFSELAVRSHVLTHRTFAPIRVPTHRDLQGFAEHTHRIFLPMFFDELVPHSWPCVKIATGFFSISRSCRVRSSSRLRRRFSSSNAVWWPLPGKASEPCSASSLRH